MSQVLGYFILLYLSTELLNNVALVAFAIAYDYRNVCTFFKGIFTLLVVSLHANEVFWELDGKYLLVSALA